MAVNVQSKRRTFFMTWPDKNVERMLKDRGHAVTHVFDNEWEIALFPGGEDVSPILYGEHVLPKTQMNYKRDLTEVNLFRRMHHKRLKVGICRGAQLLNVLSGGRLWQDVDNHAVADGHMVKFWASNTGIKMTSTHHQMMIPGPLGWVVASADRSTTKINETEGETKLVTNDWEDPEVIWYDYNTTLCWQPHPEYVDGWERQEFFDWIDTLFDPKVHEQSFAEWGM